MIKKVMSLIPVIFCILISCGNDDKKENNSIAQMLGEVQTKQDLWISKNVTSYSYRSTGGGFLPPYYEIVSVSSNTVTSIYYNDGVTSAGGYKDQAAVDAHKGILTVFDYIRTELENYQNSSSGADSGDTITIKYNAEYGYPEEYYFSSGEEGSGFTITEFTVLK